MRMQGEDGEIPEHPASTSLFNRNGPRHSRNAIQQEHDFTGSQANARYQGGLVNSHRAAPAHSTSQFMNGGTLRSAPVPANRGQQIHRPPPQSQTGSTKGKQKQNSPLRDAVSPDTERNFVPKSQFTKEQMELAR